MPSRSGLPLAFLYLLASFFFLCSPITLYAKNASLTGIELYSGPNGPAYVLVSDVLINGKFEMRACGSNPKIDKSSYGKLLKVTLSTGSSLEYGSDGVLTLTTKDSPPACVVPSELKFDKNGPFTPAELASRAVLGGKALPTPGAAADALPPFKAGVKLVFVANPDVELAEYLRAERAATISWWKDYLSKYPSAAHTAAAKESLVSLLIKQAQADFDAYQKSSTNEPSFKDLANASESVSEALTIAPSNPGTIDANQKVHAALAAQIDRAQSELKSYKTALGGHTPGYAHLTTATKLSDSIVSVDSGFAPAVDLQTQTRTENDKFETNLRSAETQADAKRFDDAWSSISPYDSFAKEVPRLASIVDRVYQFHFDRGQSFSMAGDWGAAIEEFQKSLKIKPSPEVAAALTNANTQLLALNNKKAADAALQQSQNYEQQRDYIQAYEVLANLPPAQRSLTADEMQRLSPSYVESALQAAKELQRAHDPIGGLADELAIERAHGYVERAYALQNDPNLKDRLDDISNLLSDYYLAQAKRYLDKPLGSGAGLGWSFLDKALQYKASNLGAVRDEMTMSAGAYQLRSWLSIRVAFRDQTSRRDSAGFAEQLADAIATGLETSGLPVRVIRPGETPVVEPNFQLIGDVLQHARTITSASTPKDSKYRAGEQEVPNLEWNSMNREYEAANLELQSAQQALSAIVAKGKKKDIADANERITEAQKKVLDIHTKLDLIPKTTPVDILKPYTYTQKESTLGAIVQLQFRIIDSAGNQVEGNVPVSKDANQKFTQLENVKPEDTEGVKPQSTVPDDIQFLTGVENATRDSLIEAAKQSVAKLPQVVLAQARSRTQTTDFDGAAEDYILYLNSTPDANTPEHQEAQKFLLDQYNIKRMLNSSSR